MRTPVSFVVTTVLALLVTGCSTGSDDGGSPQAAASPATNASTGSPSNVIDATFDAGGHELHLNCLGDSDSGEPTIIYLHGLGGQGGDVHQALAPELSKRTRLCTYDRLNVGLSGHEDGDHTGADSVKELHELLAAADVRPPYLLLGFSFGGLLGVMYAGTYPDDVTGLLMLDASLPSDAEVDALIPAKERRGVIDEQQANGEHVDFYATLEEAKPLVERIPDIPVTYLAARPVDLPSSWPVQRMRELIAAKQKEFVQQLPQGRLVPVQSSHDVDLDKPEVVLAEVDRMLGEASSG